MNSLGSVLETARHWPVRYRKRQIIYEEGDQATAMFRLDRGCVRLQVNGIEGHRQIISFLFPGDLFGVCLEGRASAAEAVTDVELTCYSLPSLLQLSASSTEVMIEFMRAANSLINELAHHLEHVAHLGASERVLWFLSWVARRQGGGVGRSITLPMSFRDVGDFLAISPETLSRVIRDLEARNLVEPKGRRSFVLRHPVQRLRPPGEPHGSAPAFDLHAGLNA